MSKVENFDENAPQPVVASSTNPPPPPPYEMAQPQQTVIIQPVMTRPVFLSKYPSPVICPSCKANVMTRVRYKSGCGTWLVCLCLCFIGLDLGCQFIPFCINTCKDAHHTCPNCNMFLGRKDFL